jgi:ribonuclease BN (tRNA processing enzyme)
MRVTVVGCAGSFPGADSASSCYLLEAEGFRLVIDLGNGALGALQRHIGLGEIDAICLSHLHADHCFDLHSYRIVQEFIPGGPLSPTPVFGPAGTAERLAMLRGGMGGNDRLGERLILETLTSGTREIGPFRITTAHMNHPIETFGFRVEYDGWTAVYSADTGESETLVKLARNADLLLCEASFLDEPGNPADVHLSAREAGEHAAKADAGELVLTHLVAWNNKDATLAEAAAVFHGQLSLAAAGQAYGPRVAGRLCCNRSDDDAEAAPRRSRHFSGSNFVQARFQVSLIDVNPGHECCHVFEIVLALVLPARQHRLKQQCVHGVDDHDLRQRGGICGEPCERELAESERISNAVFYDVPISDEFDGLAVTYVKAYSMTAIYSLG